MAARISQHGIEVARSDDAALVRVTQVICEVMRPVTVGLPPAERIFPVLPSGRVTIFGTGTRVFPV